MYCWLIIPLSFLGITLCYPQNDKFEVMDVSCAINEEVSCLIIKCPDGQHCPAKDFCFNPKCICRRGYRRVKGVCVKKRRTHNLTNARAAEL